MLRSFYRVLHADAGFRSEGLVIANVALPQTGYSEPAKRAALFERVLAELKSAARREGRRRDAAAARAAGRARSASRASPSRRRASGPPRTSRASARTTSR